MGFMSGSNPAYTDDRGKVYVGDRLKEFRKRIVFKSQEGLAADLNVTQSMVHRWETNKEPMPEFYMKKILEVYSEMSIGIVERYRTMKEQYFEVVL